MEVKRSDYCDGLHSLCMLIGEPYIDYSDLVFFNSLFEKLGIFIPYRNLN